MSTTGSESEIKSFLTDFLLASQVNLNLPFFQPTDYSTHNRSLTYFDYSAKWYTLESSQIYVETDISGLKEM